MPGLQMKQAKILEAVLFAAGDNVSLRQLANVVECDVPTTRNILLYMAEHYQKEEAGIQLIELNDSFQLCTNPQYHAYAQKIRPEPARKNLTQPLLETLSIIAYKQPVTKAMIEEIRGVTADHAVNKLMEYGLVAEQGRRMDAPGRPILFGTSDNFLRKFGLRNVDDFLLQNENILPEDMIEDAVIEDAVENTEEL